eukprot:906320-Pleurochrysis_carterae.AAC.1
MPKRVRKEDIPSGRARGPEKRMRARREDAAGGDLDSGIGCGMRRWRQTGWLFGVSVCVAGEGSCGVRRRKPRVEALVEVHVGCNDDAVRRGHPDVVGTGRPYTATEVNADPSARVHAGFGVGGT